MAEFANMASVRIQTVVGGKVCYNNLFYVNDEDVMIGVADEILNAFVAECLNDWAAVLSTAALITEASISVTHTPPIIIAETAVLFPGLAGTIASDSLPPFVTATLLKYPNNLTLSPSSGTPFERPGRIPISGVPESAQTLGVFETAYRALIADLGDQLNAFTYDDGVDEHQFTLAMFKWEEPSSLGTVAAIVDNVTVGRIGSQNTRKT